MRVLIYVLNGRHIPESLNSALEIDTSQHETTILFDRERNNPVSADHQWQVGSAAFDDWYERHCQKLNRARDLTLLHGYDALLTIEDDIKVPPDALNELISTGTDIAYGLTVWRNPPHKWSATIDMEWGSRILTYSDNQIAMREAWGKDIDCVGCGLFCTLIRRPVLEKYPFRRIKPAAADWALALDAKDGGFTQKTNTRVICGHIHENSIYWPTQDGYKEVDRWQ